MGRSRYKIYEPTYPYFATCTILNWIPIFTREETVHISKEILGLLQKQKIETILKQLKFYKKAHKTQSTYQLWQEGFQPKLIQNEKMFIDRMKYIHHNPVKRGYVDEAKHWRYSSARDYEGEKSLIDIERVRFA